MTTNIKTNSQ